MIPAFIEPADIDDSCEIRLGVASWDNGSRTAMSVKFAWRVEGGKGKIARGGEVPVEALPQMLDFSIRNGYLKLTSKPGKQHKGRE